MEPSSILESNIENSAYRISNVSCTTVDIDETVTFIEIDETAITTSKINETVITPLKINKEASNTAPFIRDSKLAVRTSEVGKIFQIVSSVNDSITSNENDSITSNENDSITSNESDTENRTKIDNCRVNKISTNIPKEGGTDKVFKSIKNNEGTNTLASKQANKETTSTSGSSQTKTLIQIPKSTTNLTMNRRSPVRKDSTSSESEEIESNSDQEDDSLDLNEIKISENDVYTTVTKSVYDERAAEIQKISSQIKDKQGLLQLSSKLPDRGDKIKKLIKQLTEDLDNKRNDIKHLKVMEEMVIKDDFQNMSISEHPPASQRHANHFNKPWKSMLTNLLRDFPPTTDSESKKIADLLKLLDESLQTMPKDDFLADQPSLLNVNLMKHQRQALAWMEWREKQFPKGGILGDDMGLGKTVSMISLIARQIEARKNQSTEQKQNGGHIKKNGHLKSECNGRTLVVCPSSLVKQWENEIKKFTCFGGVLLHHGEKRSTNTRDLTSAEIVLTTYGIVKSEFDKVGPVSQINWERIILDEANNIKNHRSKQSKDCCELKGSIKWCLTGTPIQNSEQDIFALLKFIGCGPLGDLKGFRKFTEKHANERISLILKFVMLRRMKCVLQKNGEMATLPEKKTEIVPVTLDDDEMQVYRMILVSSQQMLRTFLDDWSKKNNGSIKASRICLAILRLRQICIHPNLIDAMLTAEDLDITSAQRVLQSDEVEQLNEINVASILSRSNPVFNPNRISSKFKAVLNLIQEKVIKSGEKAVIVSQFTSVLKLFKEHISNQGLRYLMLTGETKIPDRMEIVRAFNEDTSEQILLLSLTAGGVGLNLCGGNHLFLIDPHWNPQIESQAEDRIYRIGQERPVTIYRFICKGTIEERIQYLQNLKRDVANSILNRERKDSEMKLTLEHMVLLINES